MTGDTLRTSVNPVPGQGRKVVEMTIDTPDGSVNTTSLVICPGCKARIFPVSRSTGSGRATAAGTHAARGSHRPGRWRPHPRPSPAGAAPRALPRQRPPDAAADHGRRGRLFGRDWGWKQLGRRVRTGRLSELTEEERAELYAAAQEALGEEQGGPPPQEPRRRRGGARARRGIRTSARSPRRCDGSRTMSGPMTSGSRSGSS